MCLLCIEFQKQRMTIFEARRAFGEMREGLPPAHVEEVEKMLAEAEKKEEEEAAQAAVTGPEVVRAKAN